MKSDFERAELNKEKTGVEIKGIKAINPITNEEMQIWISDYVLITYGTGAIMAVPAHDTRDFEFAKKFNLPIKRVIVKNETEKQEELEEAYTDTETGILVNSGMLDGLQVKEAIEKIIKYIEENKLGKRKVNYKLRDWVFSRQRYWGEPIPMVYCEECGWVPVPEDRLPLKLPEVQDYEPGENGESPLAKQTEWINTTCPHCGKPAKRETDTMPQWAGSSWYYLRYMDPHNTEALASKEALQYWSPIDWYNGGMEHTARHLLYARFWNQFLFNHGLVPNKEPIDVRVSHGMILGPNGVKMSKSKGNVINPDEVVEEFGADALRTYEMFIGDYEKDAAWSTNGLKGCKKFLDRIWRIQEKLNDKDGYTNETLIHQTIKKVSNDLETMKYNTAVSSLMILLNELEKEESITKNDLRTLIHLLNPIAPHITEEINEHSNLGSPLCESTWPVYDENKTIDDSYEMVVQVNGKVRATMKININEDEEEIKKKALALENVINHTKDKEIIKVIVIKGKIVNIVVK